MKHSTRQLELINARAFLVPAELRARKPLSVKIERLFYLVSRRPSGNPLRGERESWSIFRRMISRLLKKVLKVDPEKFDFGTDVYFAGKNVWREMDPCKR